MRTDLTTGFSNAMAAAANAPVLLLRIEWPALGALAGLTLRFSDRALVIGGQTWEARVLDWQRDASGAVRSMTLWNGVSNPAAGFARFSDLLQAYPPELAEVVLYRWFDGAGLDETDFAALFSGMLADPIEFDETECRLGLAPYSETLGRKVVGAVLATSDYPNLPEENLGAVKPIVIGSVSDAPGLRVRRVNRTRLISVAAPGAETLDVGDTSGFPASGALVVNDDEVAYTGRTAQAFTGCTGVSEFHYADDEVLEKISDHRFLFSDADYPIQSIANVKVSGEPVDPAGYMVDLAKGEVVFTAQPREVSSVDTKFLQAQFDEVAAGNTALDPETAMQPNLRTSYARISQANRKLNLRQADVLPALGQIGRVLLRVEHFMEERLVSDSVAVRLSGLGQVGTLSLPGADDRALTSGSTDITHNHLDTFGFPINIPTPVISPTSQADHVVEQGAVSGIGKNQSLIAGVTTVGITFPSASFGVLKGEYQINLNVNSGLFGIGDASLYLHGQRVAQWNPSRGNFDYTPSFTINGAAQPSSMTLAVGANGGQWTVDVISVKRLLFYPHATSATQQSQQTVKSGGTSGISQQPVLSAVTEKPSRTVVDFFDVTDSVAGDWNWLTGREVEVEYTGSGDGRTVFVLHTAFEIEYARRRLKATDVVTADVSGVIDSAGGTVTGTPLALLERPDHVFAWSLTALLGLPQEALDSVSFSDAGSRFENAVPGGYRLSGVVLRQQTLAGLWKTWSLSSRCRISWNAAGQAQLEFLPVNSSSDLEGAEVRTLDSGAVLLEARTGKPRFCLRRGSMQDLLTRMNFPYARNWSDGDSRSVYRGLLKVEDAALSGLLGAHEKAGGFALDWCAGDAMAQDLGAFYLAESARPPTLLECDAVLEHLDLEPGDIVKLDLPNLGFNSVFARLDERLDLTPSDSPDGLHAVRLVFHLFPIERIQQFLPEAVQIGETWLMGLEWSHAAEELLQVLESASLHDLPAPAVALVESLEASFFHPGVQVTALVQMEESVARNFVCAATGESAETDEAAFAAASGGWGAQSWGFSGWGGREHLV